jgi:excisionase family DNA binding protein
MAIDPVPMEERLIEVAAVAHRLSVSREYVYALIRDGHLPGYRLPNTHWRIKWTDLQAFIEQTRTAAVSPRRRTDDHPAHTSRPVLRAAVARSSTPH